MIIIIYHFHESKICSIAMFTINSLHIWRSLNATFTLCQSILQLLRSEIPSGICAKLRTVAASNNRVHMPWSLCYCLFAPHVCMVLFFTHIPFVVNHTINATPPETLQHNLAAFWRLWLLNLQGLVISVHMSFLQLKDIEQHGPTIGLRAACGPWKHSAKIFKSEIC